MPACGLRAGFLHILKLKMEAGHTCFPREGAVKAAAEFLQEEEAQVQEACGRLSARGALAENTYNGVAAIALSNAYLAESYAAYRIVQLAKALPKIEVASALVEDILKRRYALGRAGAGGDAGGFLPGLCHHGRPGHGQDHDSKPGADDF